MSTVAQSPVESTALRRNALGVAGIVFLVLAAVAPLTGIVVVASLAIALGNGGGTPMSFFLVAAILLLFAVGYAQMSKQLVSAGGFYAFVVKGLGRTGGLVAGFIATLGYNFFVVGTIGTSGFFMQVIIADLTGFDLHWYLWGLASIVVCFVLARAGVDFSSKVLGVALVLEVLILVVFDISVLVQTGYDVSAFSPESVLSGSLPIGLLLAATGFLGFEATALFGEEARDPLRTVPRATYTAIASIGVILGVTTWAVVSATGVAQAQQTALDHLESGDLVFALAQAYLGGPLTTVMIVLLLVSLFAAMLAFHNSATRYLYSLGRARVLPQSLARTRPGGAPQVAGLVQAGFAAVVAALFAVAGADPIGTLVPAMLGFGTLSVLVLQGLAALSIVVHFRRSRDPRAWSTLVAPGIGFLGLLTIVVMAVANFDIVAGSDALVIRLMPLLLVLALVGGIGYGAYLRKNRPETYRDLADDLERFNVHAAPAVPPTGT
ncbi:APC family permease [Myceligenerans xiligouense]|uniref:Amino acid/polyamine/organocation transporter (APC superfamily) n=1 Tax=Myceligenerans xiligouense TaxID=253184 RepID=A0A3N4ZLR1_9MICO|nr:APC family permease [Myceligenerans xiligouense]RPF21855.1 amino acid/polyamine/organocation transporter (APC superfamily) [Myceligenerans xiligouense]